MKNNIIFISFFVFINLSSYSQIKINEVMHLPLNKEPEWIELINFHNDIIDSLELIITDPKGSFPFKLKNVLPCQYIVLVKDTNLLKKYRTIPDTSKLVQAKIPSLNNTGDSLILKNKNGDIIDYFFFGKDFGRSGITLERIKPDLPADNKENIQASIATDSATCGRINSQSFKQQDTIFIDDGIEIEPNPFSPNSSKNKTKISLHSKEYVTNLSIKIYDVNGYVIKDLISTTNGDKFTKKVIEWNGTNNLDYLVPMGAYPVIIEYEIESSKQKVELKKIIVVGN